MKKIITVNSLIVLMLIITGCTTLTKPSMTSSPPLKMHGNINITTNLIDDSTTQSAVNINNSRIYYSQLDGANAAIGILGGAIGNLINSSLIESKTSSEAKAFENKGKTIPLIEQVRNSFKYNKKESLPNTYNLEPFILIQSKDKLMTLSLVYLLKLNNNLEPEWSERYFFHFKEKVTFDGHANEKINRILNDDIQKAILKLSDLVIRDIESSFHESNLIKFQTSVMGPLSGPYAGKILQKNKTEVTIRTRGNKTDLRGVYIRGTHIMDYSDVTFVN